MVALAAGTDGSIWFTEFHAAAVGKIDSAGRIHVFALPALFSGHGPNSIAVMPDGTAWVNALNMSANPNGWLALEEINPEDTLVRTYRIPRGSVTTVAPGPDGLPWFSYGAVPWGLGRLETGGSVQILPWKFFSEATSMVLGPDGRMWFAANDFANAYGYYDLSGKIERPFVQPDPRNADATAVAAGPNDTVALVSRDNSLYEINTGYAPPQVSSIAYYLPSPTEAFASVTRVAVGAAIAMGAILFITFPSQLFNLTFQVNYAEIRDWWRRLTRKVVRIDRRPVRVSSTAREWTAFGVVLVLGALTGALLDPNFGSSISSVDTYVAILLAICTGIAVPALATGTYHRVRGENRAWKPHAILGGLAVAVVCVVVSRLTKFEPGYLYGVICGITFTAKLNTTRRGHVVAISTVATVVVAVLAWFAWIPVNSIATRSGASFALVILDDFLASVFVGGLVGTMIALLPLRFLPGWDLRRWRPAAWTACFFTVPGDDHRAPRRLRRPLGCYARVVRAASPQG